MDEEVELNLTVVVVLVFCALLIATSVIGIGLVFWRMLT
jgi:hypothetical protein